MKFCSSCGAKLEDTARFCPACGQKAVAPPQPQIEDSPVQVEDIPKATPAPSDKGPERQGSTGQLLFLLIGLGAAAVIMAVLFICGIFQLTPDADQRMEGPGYRSAEDAAMAYAEYLKQGDLDGMLSTFAIESYVENFDQEKYLKQTGFCGTMFTSADGIPLSKEGELSRSLNLEIRRRDIDRFIFNQYMRCLLSGTEYEEKLGMATFALRKQDDDYDDQVRRMVKTFRGNPGFSDMVIGEARPAAGLLPTDEMENYERSNSQWLEWYGAEEIRDVCVDLHIGGEDYTLFLAAGRYGGRWYNLRCPGGAGMRLGCPSYCGLASADELNQD